MTAQQTPSVGTPEGLQAASVYINTLAALQDSVHRLARINRGLMLFVGLLICCLLVLLPFKKVVPFFYEVDASTGRVSASGKVAEELKVSDKNIAYFLRLWTARLVTINASTLKTGLPGAYRWTRSSAPAELDTWIEKTDQTANRIGRIPGLTREILGTPVVSFNADRSVAFIDFVWIERINGVETDRRRKLLTLEFGTVAENKSLGAGQISTDDHDNPLGLVITHFTINDQDAK